MKSLKVYDDTDIYSVSFPCGFSHGTNERPHNGKSTAAAGSGRLEENGGSSESHGRMAVNAYDQTTA